MSIQKKFLATVFTVAAVLCLYSVSAFAMGTDVKVANSNVNMRTGPGTGYPVITVVPSGTQLYIEQDLGDWLFVDYNAPSGTVQGYCCAAYVGAKQAVATPTTPVYYGNYYVTNDVRLRSGPGTGYAIYTTIPGGHSINVMSVANGWAYASYAGINGYVSTSYINGLGGSYSSGSTSAAKGNIAYAGDQVLTSSDFTNLYSSMGGGSVVMQLCAGSRLSVLGRSSGWYNVSYNGYNGWIPATQLCKNLGGACLTT